MPTYEYVCEACAHHFEQEQRITEDALKKCPKCKKSKLKRLVGSGNFLLKGSGWYSDLYSGPSNRKSTESNASSSETTSSDSKTTDGVSSTDKKISADTKPSPKTTTKEKAGSKT